MSKKRKISLQRILSNNWVVTLTATLIGVFIALYLNEWVASNKLRNQKAISIKNISEEISSNKMKLQRAAEKHKELFETLSFVDPNLTEDQKLMVHSDSMNSFQSKYPGIIEIVDSTLVENSIYQYSAEIKLDFTLPQLEISTIAWETLLNSGISSTYSYECLLYLGTVNKILYEIRNRNEELLKYFFGSKDPGEKSKNMRLDLKFLIEYEHSTIELLGKSEEEIGNCAR